MIENRQIRDELTAIAEMQALTAAVTYQQIGAEHELDVGWPAARLVELAAVVDREAQKGENPQFGLTYAELLRKLAKNVAVSPAHRAQLTVVDGGKQDDHHDGPGSA